MLNILLTNDDGISATGIRKLAEALKDLANIYVCAPHMQRSASGHGITIGSVVHVEDVNFEHAKMAISMEGTPADCVKMGLSIYEKRGIIIHKVFSGINAGANIGTDTLYSGTVSAAVEGAMCGLPSVAMSIFNHEPIHYGMAMKMAKEALEFDGSLLMNEHASNNPDALCSNLVLNINIPHLEEKDIAGIKVVPLGIRQYDEWYSEVDKTNENARNGYLYGGNPVHVDTSSETNDVSAIQNGYATITPLHFDLTNHRLIEKLKSEWKTV